MGLEAISKRENEKSEKIPFLLCSTTTEQIYKSNTCKKEIVVYFINYFSDGETTAQLKIYPAHRRF